MRIHSSSRDPPRRALHHQGRPRSHLRECEREQMAAAVTRACQVGCRLPPGSLCWASKPAPNTARALLPSCWLLTFAINGLHVSRGLHSQQVKPLLLPALCPCLSHHLCRCLHRAPAFLTTLHFVLPSRFPADILSTLEDEICALSQRTFLSIPCREEPGTLPQGAALIPAAPQEGDPKVPDLWRRGGTVRFSGDHRVRVHGHPHCRSLHPLPALTASATSGPGQHLQSADEEAEA